jgi:uncharacterized membrane protein
MKRAAFIDVLRGIAILLMVVDHIFDWLLDEASRSGTVFGITHFLGTLAAPLFLFLAGFGLALSFGRGGPFFRKALHVVQRGLTLVLAGYLINFVVYFNGANPQEIMAVDVLPAIGLSLILCLPLAKLPFWLTGLLTLAGAAAGQWLGATAVLPDGLAAYLTGRSTVASYFPLLVWFPYAWLGLTVAKAFTAAANPRRFMQGLALLGLLLIAAVPLVNPGMGYRHPRPVFLCFSSAILFWLTAAVWWATDRLLSRSQILFALQEMGKASMMLYVFHHLVGYRLYLLLGWASGRSFQGDFGIFGPWVTTLLFVVMVLLMLTAAYLWNRRSSEYSPAALFNTAPKQG